ncbi:uncharacterized protein L3040_006599 [Drepanopeziza brunnea f. sp. 'multigermtubi']|uniref:uncharacterized protein n=1 Tax=Drepanopeziza brunnea f. sp. 'multigermtubi' TaxID=698441 RepID=UPI00239DD72C|nr:hypothetical protein L3040_006599 [Drepanopeziza brunnea f. sp. 'multigermtubi']
MGFLGVYKAVYDYAPQGASEIAIAEGDILYVLEKSDEDDWWKVKKKASGEEDEEPTGLVPNNYIEEAHPTHHARALYDYTRQTDEELSFTEEAVLEVFDTSDPDWILVGFHGEYGFVPANYIDIQDKTAQPDHSEPPPPSLSRRPPTAVEEEYTPASPASPASPVNNPAAALAGIINQRKSSAPAARAHPAQYTPEDSDEDEGPPPAMPTRPISVAVHPESHYARSASPASPSGPRMSPPYNRASLSRNIDDEVASHLQGGFHMYNINEMVSVMGKRKKMPTTLGINLATGVILIAPEKARDGPQMTWSADKLAHYSIEGKHVFLELVRPSKSVDFHAGAKDTATEIVSALGELAGAVRAEGLREVIMAGTGQSQKKGQILYDFMAQGDDEVTVAVGDEIYIVDDSKSDEWWQVKRLRNGKEGVVPSSYVEVTGMVCAPTSSGLNAGKSAVDQNRLDEERMAKESLRAARREEERGSESSRNESGRDGRSKTSKSKPDPAKVRTWTDRSKSFSVEAQFLALKDGKINLHKMNGVKIAVPVVKMSVEDLEYVERATGISLDEDKPLSDIKKQRGRTPENDSTSAGARIEPRPTKPEYDWFQFFLSCDVAVGLCERYAQAFNRDSMDESVLPDIDATVLRTLGIREGDIIKIMRFLDKKYNRSGKRNVNLGGDEAGDESSVGLFSGPGGTLKNNTRKGRPAPAVQTNDIVDADAFKQGSNEKTVRDGVATPLTSMPTPAKKDEDRPGFEDDAWSVKPSKQQPQATQPPQTAPAPAPATLTGSFGDLSLLSQPLEPTKIQPTPPVAQPPQQPPQQQAPPQPQGATPSFFAGIGQQQTGLPQQQTGLPQQQATQFSSPHLVNQLNIARQRPAPPGQFQSQGSLMLPAPPSRPLSAPQANQQSGFSLPPLQAQNTGIQNSSGFQTQIAPPGQSLNDMRMQQQQYAGFNGSQMINQPQNFGQVPQNGFQYPAQTGMQPGISQPFMNNGGGPFADSRPQSFAPLQQQPTGFQSSFGPAQQRYSQPVGVNSFLPPPLQPQQTAMPQQQQQNGFSSFPPPPIPPVPQQNTVMPLVPQKTGPPPPVRFGVTGDTKKLMPQATGRRANLSQATPQNPFGF